MATKIATYSQGYLTGPAIERSTGSVYVCSYDTNELFRLVPSGGAAGGYSLQRVRTATGMPTALAFDADNNLFVADNAYGAIFSLEDGAPSVGGGVFTEYVREYESRPLKGPSAVAFDQTGNLFFCDAGPSGTTGFGRATGSLYCVTADNSILTPLLLECLADPSGVAVGDNGNALYVCEKAMNRIVRLVKTQQGPWEASVFHNFSGKFGPSCITVDPTGNLVVGRFEPNRSTDSGVAATDGEVVILSPSSGIDIRRIVLPGAPEITGIVCHHAEQALYVTEGSTHSIFRIQLG